MNNNIILFMFGLIFLSLGVISPIINAEFNTNLAENDVGKFEDVAQNDITSSTAIQVLGGLFFWVFNAPLVINILLTIMRVVFWIIVFDKIRGVGS